jgi:hypothetical protein
MTYLEWLGAKRALAFCEGRLERDESWSGIWHKANIAACCDGALNTADESDYGLPCPTNGAMSRFRNFNFGRAPVSINAMLQSLSSTAQE